jgi:carboxypeptidase Q
MTRHTFALLLLSAAPAAAFGQENVDLATIHRIKDEAFRGSHVMDHLFYLTDVNGPRLTNSPGFRAAADWSAKQLKDWGVASARLEKWGTFGRGWSLARFSAHMKAPVYAPLLGMPMAWSAATPGPVTAEVVAAPLFSLREDPDRFDLPKVTERIRSYTASQKGKLKGRIVLIEPVRELTPPTEPASERYDDKKLADVAGAPDPFAPPPLEWPITRLPEDEKKRWQILGAYPAEVLWEYVERLDRAYDRLNTFLHDEGAVAVLSTDQRGAGGILFAEKGGLWARDAAPPPVWVVLQPEAYYRLARLVERKIPVKVELDVAASFHDDVTDGVNVVAEIPGQKKKDEVVMLGAHLDSWHSGTGATDNAAGCAVALEAMRILKALDLPMDRTVRIALWSGEEQGLYGSRGYVKEHFGDPVTMTLKPEHAKLAAYFNVDNGTGKIRGVYLQGNDMVRPIFESWLGPFRDLGATTLTIRNTGGTDHQSFDDLGLPGFQFIQDPLDYGSRTHHSNLDVYDHVVPADLMQASALLASFVYEAATRPEMLPRKPLPRPLPKPKDP